MGRWQALIAILAITLAGTPGPDLLTVQAAEPLESSAPSEECVDSPVFHAPRRCSRVRRMDVGNTGPKICHPIGTSPVGSASRFMRLLPSGHRLANNLCAPLRC